MYVGSVSISINLDPATVRYMLVLRLVGIRRPRREKSGTESRCSKKMTEKWWCWWGKGRILRGQSTGGWDGQHPEAERESMAFAQPHSSTSTLVVMVWVRMRPDSKAGSEPFQRIQNQKGKVRIIITAGKWYQLLPYCIIGTYNMPQTDDKVTHLERMGRCRSWGTNSNDWQALLR